MYTNECLFKDVYTIIEMMPLDMKNKISKNFIKYLSENQDAEFEGTISKNVPLKKQEIRVEIKLMLSLMYISYFCTEDEKKQILKIENENINNFYNRDIFKEKRDREKLESVEDVTNEQLAMVEYKENIIQKLINKIKKFLNRKNNNE